MKTLYKITFLSTLLIFAGNIFAQQTERQKGIEFYEKGDFNSAVFFLEKVVEANQADNVALGFLGMSYAQLEKPEKARAAFKKASEIELSADDTTFDRPLKLTSRPMPRYTDEARRNNVSGIVILAVEFKMNGKIGNIFPLKELPHGLTKSAVRAMRGVKFKPAMKNGKPVSVIKSVQLSFAIYL